MDNKKLIILVPAFPGEESGSFMVPFIQQFLDALSKNHEDLELIIYSLYMPTGEPYVWNNIKVIPLNGKKNNPLAKLFFVIKTIFIISLHIRKYGTDGILNFWYNETALIGKTIAFLHSKKQYTWLQGQDVKKSNFYINFFRPKRKSLIALSTHQNDILYNEFGIRANITNPIAVNPSFFPPLNKKDRTIDILGAGSLIPLKNYQLFLDIILEIKNHYNNIKVVLIGNGPQQAEFARFIKENKLQDTIILPGLLTHKETLAYMNTSSIFLHTSNFEGGGMVLYESLYSGCQVVSTIPIEDINTDQFHYCVSEEEIIDTLKQLIANPKPVRRSACTNIEETTKVIYELFFN